MKRFLKILVDLKFGFKVGGGFLAVLLLTAVVGGVGFLAIHNLSSSFIVADQAAKIAGQVQAASLMREDYLNNPTPEQSEAVRQAIADLDASLETLANEVAGNPASEQQVAGAQDAVAQFAATFNEVVGQTSQQADRLGTLQKSTADLEAVAGTISDAVLAEERRNSSEAMSANSRLDDTNQLQRSVYELKDDVVKVHFLYLKGSGNLQGKDLEAAIDIGRKLVSETKQMQYKKIEGIKSETIVELGSLAKNLNEALQKPHQGPRLL
ncbi:hypothetical protein QW131_27780 [Roseibium salinum]|nr:hypothetical protein [Roseibium salinum]